MSIYDFSEYQGTIDFGKVKGNAELLILRVQAGSTHPDKDYAQYVAGCKTNKIPFGSYAYGKYINVADAQQEAKDCFARIDKDTQFVVLDVESVSTTIASQLISATQAFIDYLHAQGVKKVGLYSGENFYKTNGLSTVKADFIWIANYGVNDGNKHNKPSIACDLWQYSSSATESGVVGNVDIDTLNGSKTLSYFTGVSPSPVAPTQPLEPAYIPTNNGIIAKVKVLVAGDIRVAPTHNSLFVRNSVIGEEFDVYAVSNDWHNVGGANWVLGNNGANLTLIAQYNPPLNPPAPKPVAPAPKPVAPTPEPTPVVAPQPSANVSSNVSGGQSDNTNISSGATEAGNVVSSAPETNTQSPSANASGNNLDPLVQQVEDEVMKDPTTQQSFIKKFASFIKGLLS